MATKPRKFENNQAYHILNRGVEKRAIFLDSMDYSRFLLTLAYYQQKNESRRFSFADFKLHDRKQPFKFDVLAYCLMPNHFHLLIRQNFDHGITQGISQLLNSYTRYFNTRHHRVGHLFQGPFKAIHISSDEQFVHLARYIFLNPYASQLTDDVSKYQWSAYPEYFNLEKEGVCNQQELNEYFSDKTELKNFIFDYADYARSLQQIKDTVLDY